MIIIRFYQSAPKTFAFSVTIAPPNQKIVNTSTNNVSLLVIPIAREQARRMVNTKGPQRSPDEL